jgi:S-adenosylmethionine:tRNA ribosyltransferase-isomerase
VLESATGPGPGVTSIFLRAPGDLRVVDVLFTNFHLPGSSLLMLVTAFGGHERVMAAYRHAVEAGYRFYSYGDACLIARADGAARAASTC